MIGGLGMPELLVIMVIVLIIFGAISFPRSVRALAKGFETLKRVSKIGKKSQLTSSQGQ